MIRWALWIVLALGGVVAVVALIGATLPKAHSVSRTTHVPMPPEALYTLLTDVDRYPTWRGDVKKFERLPDRDGKPAWIETMTAGRIPMYFERMERPTLLVGRIADPSLPFGGTWTYRIAPAARGSDLTIREDGEVYNPIFRFMSRFVFSQTATIETFMKNLEAKAGARG
jgi:uncharacterized protein YndB with AHSA1/START domain